MTTLPTLVSEGQVIAEVQGRVGVITLNRAAALNALSLGMIRDITSLLHHWAVDEAVHAVLVRGAGREGKPAAFCAGGDIRFFHQAALSGDPRLEDFFTEEYELNHLIHTYRKPYIALMDGVVMGGGMGISQGASHRIVTEHSKLAMPETNIGLFPDVGGGWFLSRCPGRVGEFLALTGQALRSSDAIAWGLADHHVLSERLPAMLRMLSSLTSLDGERIHKVIEEFQSESVAPVWTAWQQPLDRHFSQSTLSGIMDSLGGADGDAIAREVLATLGRRSPLMMAVTLEQVRRARGMSLADDLRMERDLVRHCFHLRSPSETVEGIRALAIDKDHAPRWNPSDPSSVSEAMVKAFFISPWPACAHPLRHLSN